MDSDEGYSGLSEPKLPKKNRCYTNNEDVVTIELARDIDDQQSIIETPEDQSFKIENLWRGSVSGKESSLHQISPYIGKMKSAMANYLLSNYTKKNSLIFDPFCGSGTVALEAWILGRNVIANDLNPYAVQLTKAKLNPPASLSDALEQFHDLEHDVESVKQQIEVDDVPQWVQAFYHPETLREAIAWFKCGKKAENDFIIACLLGILHHQRPGFLSYPSSHTTPYLRDKKFPKKSYPNLYTYRPVNTRLEKKILRTMKRVPELDFQCTRECYQNDASSFYPCAAIDTIITSPPYMHQLDYARDNRLRLWFLGYPEWSDLDKTISPSEKVFFKLIRECFKTWHDLLRPKSSCILVIGNGYCHEYDSTLSDALEVISTQEVGGFNLFGRYTEPIPDDRRARKSYKGSTQETIIVLRKG